jgi:hypothetical protein
VIARSENDATWHPVYRRGVGQRFNDHVFARTTERWKVGVVTREVPALDCSRVPAPNALQTEHHRVRDRVPTVGGDGLRSRAWQCADPQSVVERRCSEAAAAIAERLDLNPSTVTEHRRRAEANLLGRCP